VRVLVACEFSGRVRDAYVDKGHDAYSCDLEPSEGKYRSRHYHCDVRLVLDFRWDLVIAHPPCTYLCNSGVRWYYDEEYNGDGRRWKLLERAAKFFRLFLDLDCPRVCVENPVMHGYAKRLVRAEPLQSLHPWQFGFPDKKETLLWLKGLPPLTPTNVLPPHDRRDMTMLKSDTPDRWKNRSRTPVGIARAMATQWGNLGGTELATPADGGPAG